ncbi:helix-turn-helix domain-containing protein [Bosea rubneri]|uniref:Helix-turn-helix domain-containing protein n=1 Tax=Bosea rubneri TaxID=3075434 RepID=A0ABU3S1M9_9HYPH|nr:helix-turn-helix domain-containing protein [Bosea sp. ZW T0_25]MDU0338683.1 helix-turn-helix domain-containing protein [Bosea sp. ZW T0_25]
MQMELARVRRLLRDGITPAQVAAELGFADQSHLNRFFKRGSGVTLAGFSRALGH